MSGRLAIAVLVSGAGTNLQALLDSVHGHEADIVAVASSVADARSTAQIAAELGCDSLHYLSLEGVYEAVGATRATHCDACFTGQYPLAGSEQANGKYSLEDQQPAGRPPLVRA